VPAPGGLVKVARTMVAVPLCYSAAGERKGGGGHPAAWPGAGWPPWAAVRYGRRSARTRVLGRAEARIDTALGEQARK